MRLIRVLDRHFNHRYNPIQRPTDTTLEIESKDIPYWYPKGFDISFMIRCQRDALYYYGVRNVDDLFTRRNLWALSAIRNAIQGVEDASVRDALMFGLTGIMLNTTRMCQDRDKLGFNKGTYYIPQVFRELVVTNSLDYKVENHLAPAFEEIADVEVDDSCISTQSSTDLREIPSNSIDYIFTDPPYAEKVQYGELNFVWEAWLGFDANWHDEEIIVNDVRGRTSADWAASMRKVMTECYRVLKPRHWLSLCYHDTSEGTWALIQDIMAEGGTAGRNRPAAADDQR